MGIIVAGQVVALLPTADYRGLLPMGSQCRDHKKLSALNDPPASTMGFPEGWLGTL